MAERLSPRSPDRVAAWQPPDLRTVAAPADGDRLATGPTHEEAAYAQGWQEGRVDLLRAGEADLTAATGACRAAATAMHQAVEAVQAQFTEAVQLLAVGIARHLVEREFAADPAHLQKLVGRALALAPLTGPVTVRLHPEDLEVLRALPGLLPAPPAAIEISWVADPEIHRAGCLLEGPVTVVDGRIDRVMLDLYERLAHE